MMRTEREAAFPWTGLLQPWLCLVRRGVGREGIIQLHRHCFFLIQVVIDDNKTCRQYHDSQFSSDENVVIARSCHSRSS